MMIDYPRWVSILNIVGMKVTAIRGHRPRKNAAHINAEFILFDDGITFIELEEQGPEYHDCSAAAKEIQTKQGKAQYDLLMDERYYGNATVDL